MMNISLEKGTTLIEYKETSQLLLVHVLLPLLFAGYIQIALVVGFPAIIVFLLNVRTKCSNQITTAVMFTLFYIQTENHFTSKVDNRRSLAPQGSTTNECCSIYVFFRNFPLYSNFLCKLSRSLALSLTSIFGEKRKSLSRDD